MALLGACFANQGDIATAIEHLDAALAIRPDYGGAIQRKIFFLDYLAEADFAVHQAARKRRGDRTEVKNNWDRDVAIRIPQVCSLGYGPN
jgi:hypothetical protein